MTLIDGLVSYWKLDESSGNRADSHGSNLLTDVNTVASGTGKIGSGADFETGNSEYLSHASNSDLQTGDIDFTFSCWVNMESLLANPVILGKDEVFDRDYVIDYFNATNAFRFYINGGDGGVVVSSSLTITSATWYLIVAWHDATANTINIQVNNGTAASHTTGGAAPHATSVEFRIGARVFSGGQGYFDGIIDEVGFWKRKLSIEERTLLYNDNNGLAFEEFRRRNPLGVQGVEFGGLNRTSVFQSIELGV